MYYLALSAARCFCRCLCCCCCCCVVRCHAKNFACCCCCCDNETKAKTAATVADFLWLSHSELFATLLAACAEIPCICTPHVGYARPVQASCAGTCINLLVVHFQQCNNNVALRHGNMQQPSGQRAAGSRQQAGSCCGRQSLWHPQQRNVARRGAASPAAAKGSCQFILHFP